ncbi:MAG: LysR family transcriptional regulator [Pantoea sp.]|uniref:LysR family transcriptional regulator n=1 Tax=Pantoea sp. TaxID=69393 RepID=UPI0039E4EE13
MNTFDMEQLRSFVAAVDAGSLTAAAPQRCLSQSALSEQLRKLEQRANQTLLVRSKSGVTPTAAGEKLLHHARHLLALADLAWRDLQGVTLSGEIRLGITDYCRPDAIVALLARYARDYPQLRLRTTMGKSAEIDAAWQRGELDLAVVMRVPGFSRAGDARQEKQLFREPLLWVGAAGLSLAQPLPLVLLPEGCMLHRAACQALSREHQAWFIRHISSGVRGLQDAVAAGLGVACLNRSAMPREGVVVLQQPVLPSLPEAEFVLLSRPADHREQGQICVAFGEILQQTLAY